MNMLFIKKNYVLLFFFSTLIAQDISGMIVFNYSHSDEDDAINGFAVKRAYLTVSKEISDDLSFKLQTDVDPNDSPQDIYIKNAKVDWKTGGGKVVIGLQGMNMFKVQETTWGRRYVDKVSMDSFKYSSAADMGVGYYRSIDKLHYSVLLTNGSGYKKSETDSHKKTSLQFVYGEQKLSSKDGFNLGLVFSHEPYDLDDDTEESTNVLGLFGGYANEGIRVGLEWNQRDDSVQDSTDNITSLYMNYDLQSNKSVFLKYNMVSSGDDDTNYLVAGMEFAPTKGLMIAPNYRNDGDNSKFAVNFQFKF